MFEDLIEYESVEEENLKAIDLPRRFVEEVKRLVEQQRVWDEEGGVVFAG